MLHKAKGRMWKNMGKMYNEFRDTKRRIPHFFTSKVGGLYRKLHKHKIKGLISK